MPVLDVISQFFTQVISMFNQLVSYLITAPGKAFYDIMYNWGQSLSSYGIIIPVIFVVIVGITGAIAYSFIEMNKSMDEGMNVSDLIGVD